MAYVYYVGSDGFDGWGVGGHTGAGYYGKYTFDNSKTLYVPLSGQAGNTAERKVGPDYWHDGMLMMVPNTKKVTDEALTIKGYLDGGEIVQRIHHELPENVSEAFAQLAEGIMFNLGNADGVWCTCQTRNLFYEAYIEAGYSEDEASAAADRIVNYIFPEESSSGEIRESGSTSYDRFYKQDDKYYHSRYNYVDGKWVEEKNQIKGNFEEYINNAPKSN